MTEEGTIWDAPNQQVVRRDASAPWDEGDGGSDPEIPVSTMTKAELLERAEAVGADVDETNTKAEIVEAIGG